MNKEKERLLSGAGFGFLQSIIQAYSLALPTFYLASLNISIVTYAFLLSIGDVISFILKPFIGYLTDRYGESRFLVSGAIIFFVSLFLIGQTASPEIIATLRVIGSVAASLMFIVVIIYGLRNVRQNPDYKVGLFNAIKNSGWIVGLLTPAFIIEKFGISSAFYAVLALGVVWIWFIYRHAKKNEKRPIRVESSFAFLKKIPLLVVLKTMDLAVFTVFLFFFTRYALQSLGLSRSIVSIIVVVEIIAFSLSNYLVGRFSNRYRRKYLIPAGILFHVLTAITMLLATALPHYFLVGIFIGIAGGFVDVWLFSKISETVNVREKGKFIGTFGWSYDLATIVGAQLPVVFVLLGLNQFSSLFVLPMVMAVAYLSSKQKI